MGIGSQNFGSLGATLKKVYEKMEGAFFGVLDYAVFAIMLFLSALVGVHFAWFSKKKQNTTSQYLMGGKEMGVFPISMSLIASYISGISLLGLPAEMYVYGTMYWLIIVSEVFVSFTMAYIYIPIFYKLQITSSYEYLGMRFNRKVQTLGSCLFVLKMLLYIPMVIYVPALAFEQVTGINLHIVTPIVCVICIFYTTLGGLSAVVWTDTIQMFVMVAGIVAVLTIGTVNIGFSNVISRNMDTQRIEFNVFTPDLTVRHTVWGVFFGNYFYWLASCSVNQAMVQRCLAMPTIAKARVAVWILAVGIIVLVSLCCYTGLVVFAHFFDCDPLSANLIKKSDQILPYFVMAISQNLPGLPGVFVSGVFSAALSTMSTGLNSMTGVIFQDLIKPNISLHITESQSSFVMKAMVVIIGSICVAMVFIVEKLGALIQAGKSLSGITAGPLLGIFSLGIFFPWANAQGALIGGITGLAVTSALSVFSQAAIAQGKIFYPKKPVSTEGCALSFNVSEPLVELIKPSEMADVFWVLRLSYLYYTLIGTMVVLLVGNIVSYLTGPTDVKTLNKDLLAPFVQKYFYKTIPQETSRKVASNELREHAF
ncbi:Sodium:solute symporter family [Nesidiocoris tenuis]|uniref:Sodium:solute symporter family n=1 Tax=Nesidiocoris tenuis TaxID=355587 RepID=A0ABN7ASB4_9HEMI|nr:Sodium:solute symporter family [Nesidiocoris tenuis]